MSGWRGDESRPPTEAPPNFGAPAWCGDCQTWREVDEEHVESDEPAATTMWMVAELSCGHRSVRRLTMVETRARLR